jgi:hypothetical protein
VPAEAALASPISSTVADTDIGRWPTRKTAPPPNGTVHVSSLLFFQFAVTIAGM